MSNSERGHTNISHITHNAVNTNRVTAKLFPLPTGVYPAHPTSLPRDLATTDKPALFLLLLQPPVGPAPVAPHPFHSTGASGLVHLAPLSNYKQACHFSSHYFDRIIFPWGSSTNYASPGSTHSRYPCCLLFLHCSPAFAWLRKPRWHHRTL